MKRTEQQSPSKPIIKKFSLFFFLKTFKTQNTKKKIFYISCIRRQSQQRSFKQILFFKAKKITFWGKKNF